MNGYDADTTIRGHSQRTWSSIGMRLLREQFERDSNIQGSYAEEPHYLQLRGLVHLQAPYCRKGCNKQDEIGGDIQSSHYLEEQVDINAGGWYAFIPSGLDRPALEYGCKNLNSDTSYHEDADRPKRNPKWTAGKYATIE